ncbi:MAG: hypothetical protein LQ350_000162 [Teloschistes chrysophthalmus]|nr:MAG: hypothetical protein LQ350_000162 [Niorma chrysophthalma]
MEAVDGQDLVYSDDLNGFYLSLIVAKASVKKVKDALELHDLLNKSLKITPFTSARIESPVASSDDLQVVGRAHEDRSLHKDISNPAINRTRDNYAPNPYRSLPPDQRYVIPTTFEIQDIAPQNDHPQVNRSRDTILQEIGLADRTDIEAQLTYRRHPSKRPDDSEKSILAQAVRKWLLSLPPSIRSKLPGDPNTLLCGCKWGYTIYTPMLLLPPTFLSKKPWPELLEGVLKPHMHELYSIICQRLKVTHVAVNGPIPALLLNMSDAQPAQPNILRSPTALVPLYGDFSKPGLPPRDQNLKEAFWVSTVQNDVRQTWAPLYTMFSRGNLSEKTRLLGLESVKTAAAAGCSAVDLYAGIGYFAFSYLKAGIEKVFCWDVNRWSLEGLRRGAEKNGWAVAGIDDADVESELTRNHDDHEPKLNSLEYRVLMFHESNKFAARTLGSLKGRIPPVRHVNCGYLPSSSDCWQIAVLVLDDKEGGWIHAHENVPIKDIETRRCEVVEIFEKLVEPYRKGNEILSRFTVGCFHVERVKTYAPGIMHCVFDVSVMPRKP